LRFLEENRAVDEDMLWTIPGFEFR